MKKFLIIGLLFLVASCGGRQSVGLDEAQSQYDKVKECMGVTQEFEGPTFRIVPGDTVTCGGFERLGCYSSASETITLPEDTNWTTVKHEYIHHILFKTVGDSDSNHESPFFLKCSGLIINNDVK